MTATAHQVIGSFTTEELERRRHRLNASELPAVLGLDRYRSPLQVFLEKKGLTPPFGGNPNTEWGLRMEPVIRQKAAEVLGIDGFTVPGSMQSSAEPWLSASPDGLYLQDDEPAVLEMKNKVERQAVHWGEPGTDQVPYDVASQTYGQMIVTGARRATIAVLFGKSDFRLYFLRRDEGVAAKVLDGARHFWFNHVLADVEPEVEAGEATSEWLKERFKQLTEVLRDATRPEKDLIKALRAVREQIADLEFRESGVVNKLKAAIGEDAGVKCIEGRITWKATKDSTHVDWEAAFTDLWNTHAIHSPYALENKETFIERFTKTKPGVRRFVPTFPKD